MFVRSLCRCGAVRSRHTWMALMVDECGAMPLAAISSFVHDTFENTHSDKAKTAADHAPSSSHESSALSTSTAASVAPGQAPAERAHAWVAVARLLCESGDWARATAVVDGLPTSFQQPARFKAIRDDWPLPRTVAEAWRQGVNKNSPPVAMLSPSLSAGKPAQDKQSTRTREADATASSLSTADVYAAVSPPATARRRSYTLYRTDELVRMAYSLRKAPSSTKAASLSMLQREQRAIIAELRQRDAIAEALQCIANWHRRQLLRPDAETIHERTTMTTTVTTTTTTAASSAKGGRQKTTAVDDADLLLFDGLGAAKSILFPGETSAAAGGVTSAFAVKIGNNVGDPPRYSALQLNHVREAMAVHPALVARCLRDRAVGDRLLRHAGEVKVADFVFEYLQTIAFVPSSAKATRASTSCAATLQFGESSALETYWRALATLLPLLHPYWRSQSKAEKEKLLQALSRALDATHKKSTTTRTSETTVTARTGAPRTREGSSEALHGGASPLQQQQQRPAVSRPQELSDKCRRAIKASAESVCSPLLHHEPQVRFLRLRTFGELAQRLAVLDIAIPNALMQCLFLCMADAAVDSSSHNSLNSAASCSSVAPLNSSNVADVSNTEDHHDAPPLHVYLAAAPPDRWLPALALLRAAHEDHDFRVTAAHERALLSGLQSISITKTWASALRVVDECERAFQVRPDERTLPTLLLNLKQQSWQDAFRVLQWVPGGDPAAASPQILRDLQLVALKHASWEVPLQLMTSLQERHADGFMNYLYCVCAAARGGQADMAFHYFSSLRLGRGRHAGWQNVSPFNELTVAVAAVAMLDHAHYDALSSFSERVLKMGALPSSSSSSSFPATLNEEKGSPLQGDVVALQGLTPDGVWMAQAARIAALLASKEGKADTSKLVDVFLRLPADSVKPVLHRFIALRCLLGMGHLRAPIRLVFDVLGHSSSPQQQRTHRGFLDSVATSQNTEGTFETRQRGTVERRKHLFIPLRHQRQQKVEAAGQLGAFVKGSESALPAQVVQLVAEAMVEEGVGAEYMTAALL